MDWGNLFPVTDLSVRLSLVQGKWKGHMDHTGVHFYGFETWGLEFRDFLVVIPMTDPSIPGRFCCILLIEHFQKSERLVGGELSHFLA